MINRLYWNGQAAALAERQRSLMPDVKFGYGGPRPNRALNPDVEKAPRPAPWHRLPTSRRRPVRRRSSSRLRMRTPSSGNTMVFVLIGVGVLVLRHGPRRHPDREEAQGRRERPGWASGGIPPMPNQETSLIPGALGPSAHRLRRTSLRSAELTQKSRAKPCVRPGFFCDSIEMRICNAKSDSTSVRKKACPC